MAFIVHELLSFKWEECVWSWESLLNPPATPSTASWQREWGGREVALLVDVVITGTTGAMRLSWGQVSDVAGELESDVLCFLQLSSFSRLLPVSVRGVGGSLWIPLCWDDGRQLPLLCLFCDDMGPQPSVEPLASSQKPLNYFPKLRCVSETFSKVRPKAEAISARSALTCRETSSLWVLSSPASDQATTDFNSSVMMDCSTLSSESSLIPVKIRGSWLKEDTQCDDIMQIFAARDHSLLRCPVVSACQLIWLDTM